MARVYHMAWIPSRRGWMKEYKGKKYAISCRQLNELYGPGIAETKDGSYQAANQWWDARKTEIDAAGRPAPRPLQPAEDIVTAMAGQQVDDLFAGLDLPPELQSQVFKAEIAKGLVHILVPAFVERLLQTGQVPPKIIERLPPARLQQIQDGIVGLRGEPTAPAEKTVEAHADAWLKTQQALVAAGQLAPDRATNVKMCLTHFKAFLGPQANIAGIDSVKVQGFYLHCLEKVAARRRDPKDGWSVAFAKETFAVAKSFVKWLWECGTIELPRNLIGRKQFKFGSTLKKVPTWTPKEVRWVISEAPGKLKLALLLMVNCGMTQVDVSDLKDDEVDWKCGRIIRKRSKTANQEGVPVVNYKLWPETFALLKQYRSGTDRVLLTESGKPYIRKELVNGRLQKTDGFTSNYAHLKRRLKFTKPMKQLRKTAATLLESHETYGRLTAHFLGHSPRSMKDRHYAAPPQELFDKAVLWLGKQLDQVPK
jgi:integrase